MFGGLTLVQQLAMNQEPMMNQQAAMDGQAPMNNYQPANHQSQMEVYYENSWGFVPNRYGCFTARYRPQNQPWSEMVTRES